MKYLCILLATCNTYTGVVIQKGYRLGSLEMKLNEYHYVMPLLTIDEFDSLKIGDTLTLDKSTLRKID